ncbi:hypothetical protein NLJ89_g3980 [Agrocybe chaxingu]|uniref:Aminotransferase class I/classII large domain-containing protein n=1 Tax=Agrocybe chaxingu TaxID=84603 RepID=A0A9W8KAB1_9AGAR|nr:hypothetical protein NLJ89_g3980 [Agrocybe chaxingu]
MSQGVPGIPPPEVVQRALGKAASSPLSFGYTSWDGEPTLRAALANEMKTTYGKGSDIQVEDVALTSGCNLAFVAAVMSLADAGDEVVLPVPWMALNLLGIKAVPLKARPEDGFTPSVEACRGLITSKTRAIVLITPNNPTGATYSPSLIASFFTLAREKNVALIIDETYRDFITTNEPPHTLFSSKINYPGAAPSSTSSPFPNHTAFQAIGSARLSPRLSFSRRSSACWTRSKSSPPRPIQLALAPLLQDLRGFVKQTAVQLRDRHALFKERLPEGWRIGAQGGYFAFVRHPYPRVKALDVSRRLAEEVGVVTLPASFFTEDKRELSEETVINDWGAVELAGPVEEEERWIRFSVANVDDERVKGVLNVIMFLNLNHHIGPYSREHLTFLEDEEYWRSALENYAADPSIASDAQDKAPCESSFKVGVSGAKVYFEVAFSRRESGQATADGAAFPLVSVKGDSLSRKEQEWWQSVVEEKKAEVSGSEYPIYELVSLHLLPLLHETLTTRQEPIHESEDSRLPHVGREIYHVLFTSHHLISPNKRRLLQQWSSSLSIVGFAKVGYPGVIYAQGERSNVEEFVSNIKAMQWLALKVRFVEPLPLELVNSDRGSGKLGEDQRWKEFSKVGKVVEEMRRIGREAYVVEMGIGSAGVNSES